MAQIAIAGGEGRIARHLHRPVDCTRAATSSCSRPWRSDSVMNLDDLPLAEFAFSGPLRDQLVAAILSGAKTSTTGLLLGYELENEPLPTGCLVAGPRGGEYSTLS